MVHLSQQVHEYTEALTQANQIYMRRKEMTTFRRMTETGHQLMLVGADINLYEVSNGRESEPQPLRMIEAVQTLVQGGGWERLQLEHI